MKKRNNRRYKDIPKCSSIEKQAYLLAVKEVEEVKLPSLATKQIVLPTKGSKRYRKLIRSSYRLIKRSLVLETLLADKSSDCGFVYGIINPVYPNHIKIGKTIDTEVRLQSYQTCTPFKDYSLLFVCAVDNRHISEKLLLDAFDREGTTEWIRYSGNKTELKKLLTKILGIAYA